MKMNKIVLFLLPTMILHSYDEILRFRPPWMWHEAYLQKAGLTQIIFLGAHGSANHSFSCSGDTIPLGDVWGIQFINKAALAVIDPIYTPFSQMLNELTYTNGSESFARISLEGNLELKEFTLLWSQNFSHGFFATGYLPARSLHVSYLSPHDLTPPEEQNNVIWKKIKNAGETFYQAFRCSTEHYTERGLGDIALSLGWTLNYEDTEVLDFIDFSVQLGIALPTSPVMYPEHMLTFELGYGGHTGYFLCNDASFGICDWLTCGAHLQILAFNDQNQIHRIKTHASQSSLFLLTVQPVEAHRNPALSAGIYLKADHVLLGLSFALGYNYVHQGSTRWLLLPTRELYNFTDNRLLAWTTQVIHLAIDYDFATFNHPNAPRIGFSYDASVAGKNSIATKLTGALWDMTIAWKF